MSTWRDPHSGEVFNSQQLLFSLAQPITEGMTVQVPEDYYERGWTVIENVPDEFTALGIQEELIRKIDTTRVPLHSRFIDRIRLAKADEIPVCDDIVASSYQVMHFDMGHPLSDDADPLLVSHVGLYSSPERQVELNAINNLRGNNGQPSLPNPTAKTRIMSLKGLSSLTLGEADDRIAAYAGKHGDGWEGHNTGRIAAGVRLLDALSDEPELQEERDKTAGQWFGNENKVDSSTAFEQEASFFARHGVNLSDRELRVTLRAGQLLFLDNTRVLHGRMGRRSAREVFNFMFGVEAIMPDDIRALRQSIGQLLVSKA